MLSGCHVGGGGYKLEGKKAVFWRWGGFVKLCSGPKNSNSLEDSITRGPGFESTSSVTIPVFCFRTMGSGLGGHAFRPQAGGTLGDTGASLHGLMGTCRQTPASRSISRRSGVWGRGTSGVRPIGISRPFMVVVTQREKGGQVMEWIQEGVEITKFFTHFNGSFREKHFDGDVPPKMYFAMQQGVDLSYS